jgi:pimeloyl-ACP methyl ester carboxylesterase
MLKPAAIPFVPLVIKEVANGNDSILPKWAVAFRDPNAFGRFSDFQSKAVLCYEGKPKTGSDTKTALLKQYPEFASFNLDFENELCNAWQPKTAGSQAFEPVVSNVPVLILSGEYDPVCPPLFGELTAKTLARSTFITVPAASHAAVHADDCTRNLTLNFLSSPAKKVSFSCVANRSKIVFITKDLSQALSGINKN